MPRPIEFKEFFEGQTDEALTIQQRMPASRRMKKLANKIKIGKKKAPKRLLQWTN